MTHPLLIMLYLGLFGFCFVVAMYRLLEGDWPEWTKALSKERRLRRKARRLRERLAAMESYAELYQEIDTLQQLIAEKAFTNPQEFLDTRK